MLFRVIHAIVCIVRWVMHMHFLKTPLERYRYCESLWYLIKRADIVLCFMFRLAAFVALSLWQPKNPILFLTFNAAWTVCAYIPSIYSVFWSTWSREFEIETRESGEDILRVASYESYNKNELRIVIKLLLRFSLIGTQIIDYNSVYNIIIVVKLTLRRSTGVVWDPGNFSMFPIVPQIRIFIKKVKNFVSIHIIV